jgi:hypothetical protein
MFSIQSSIYSASACRASSQQAHRPNFSFRSSLAATKMDVRASPAKLGEKKDLIVYAGKAKTRKAAAKRYKVTASGKVSVVVEATEMTALRLKLGM